MPTITPDTLESKTITDIGQYLHKIIEEDHEETIEAKDAYYQALTTNAEL